MNILVTGAWQGYKEYESLLKAQGHELCFLQWEKDELPVSYEWVEGIIGNGIFLSHEIEKFVNLKYIQLTSAGYDRVPMDYVEAHDIQIYNARGVYSIPMAEYVIGAVLQFYKGFDVFAVNQKKHQWNKLRQLRELNQSTACIIGCGSVGTECAKRLKAFGTKVSGVDLKSGIREYYDEILPLSDLDKVLGDADIIILTIPLNDSTKKLMNYERMNLLKEKAILVNIARGGVMDLDDFLKLKTTDVKESGRPDLRAVLDVFEQEPLPEDSPLWDLDGVIVTPHNSFVGENNQERLAQVIMNNLNSWSSYV